MPARVNLRLRLALYLGDIIERQAEAFYRDLAGQTPDSDIQRLCRETAEEERAHRILINKKLSRYQPFPLIQMELDVLDMEKKYRSLFLSRPDLNAGIKPTVEYIMDQEEKTVALYTGFLSDFAAATDPGRLIELPELERRHLEKWQKIRG